VDDVMTVVPTDAELWPTCTICEHTVNPRSETCIYLHNICTPTGCTQLPPAQPDHDVPLASPHLTAPTSRTTFLVDVASYQVGINLAAVKAAGYSAINVKLTQGTWYTHASAKTYVQQARALGLGVCTFSWIDNSASGTAQAQYAYKALQAAAGGPDGVAHQVDCEDTARPATFAIWSDYVKWWQDKLGRHVVNYTGDWWWQPRGWSGAGWTPYLWAAPSTGYVAVYPGDTSPKWNVQFGGWSQLSLLQFAVSAIPSAGGGALSKTAIRDPHVWAELTGTAQPTPLTKGDHVYFFTHIDNVPYVCDGMTCRRLTDSDVSDMRFMASEGAFQLAYGGQFREGWVPAFGVVASTQPASLTDTQVSSITQAIAAAVASHPDNPLTDADVTKIVAAVRPVVQSEIGGLVLHAGTSTPPA
jgi:hypothetical protein